MHNYFTIVGLKPKLNAYNGDQTSKPPIHEKLELGNLEKFHPHPSPLGNPKKLAISLLSAAVTKYISRVNGLTGRQHYLMYSSTNHRFTQLYKLDCK